MAADSELGGDPTVNWEGIAEGLRQLAEITGRIGDELQPAFVWLQDNGEALSRFVDRLGHVSGPDNWDGLDDTFLDPLLKLIVEPDGTPLAWLPPSEILKRSLEAESLADRDRIYDQESAVILRSARELLEHVDRQELAEIRRAAERAWDAWEAGFWEAAQAHAAACLTAVIQHGGLPVTHLADVRKPLDRALKSARNEDENELGVRLRELATFTVVALALRSDVDVAYDRPQLGFNRHLSLHTANSDQYTPANALRGLMIATATIREVQHLLELGLEPIVGFK